jgi:hypothetical protein
MVSYQTAAVASIIVIVLIVAVLFGPLWLGREKPQTQSTRERYGPPPGTYRAMSPDELGIQGWMEFPFAYTANTASSISHMIERSA